MDLRAIWLTLMIDCSIHRHSIVDRYICPTIQLCIYTAYTLLLPCFYSASTLVTPNPIQQISLPAQKLTFQPKTFLGFRISATGKTCKDSTIILIHFAILFLLLF